MVEQPAYSWEYVGSIPTTSVVGWEGILLVRSSSAIINLKIGRIQQIKSNHFDNSRKGATSPVGWYFGQVPEWSKGADLRSAVQRTRGFEPHLGQVMSIRQ